MQFSPRPRLAASVSAIALVLGALCVASARIDARSQRTANDYVVGPQDVLTITCYDQADLSGQFTVQADGTFNYALIGRVVAGGLTLRAVEASIKKKLTDGGFFKNPQIAVAVDQYKSQRIFIVGEVRSPGTYTLSGDMTLVEALARAGSTLPTSSGEAVIVHAPEGQSAAGPLLPGDGEAANIVRINLKDLEEGVFARNTALRDGDTIFVPRAQSIYVFGQVKAPGAYPMQQKNTTVLQALSLAGGLTDRAASGRIRIVRIVSGERKEIRIKLSDVVQPGDTLVVPERFF